MKYKRFFMVMLVMILLASFSALFPSLLLLLWERQDVTLTWRRVLLLVLVLIGSKVLSILLTVFREKFAQNYNEHNFRSMLHESLEMDYDSILQMGPANILDRISDSVNKIYTYMTGDYIKIWSGVITLLMCLALTATVNISLAALLLSMIPLNYFGFKMLNQELAKRSLELSRQTSEGFQEILSYTQQVDYLKQTADYEPVFHAISPSIDKLYRSMARVNVYAQSASGCLRGINDVVNSFILMTILYNFFNAGLGAYTVMMTAFILPLYFSNLSTIVNAQLNRTGFQVAEAYQAELAAHKETTGDKQISTIHSIQYDVDELVIQGKTIPFHAHGVLEKGDIVQICGPSGCGKSTFAKTLLKFRPVDQVQINGIAIADLDNFSLRSKVEYLSQNVPIFSGTLGENLFLTCGRTDETEAYFCKEPLLQTVFAAKNFDSKILEGGANLSGGEKQKVALARSLASHPDVLILDEVCSNIDQAAAETIYHRLNMERNTRITIIISHDDLPDGLVNKKINYEI